MNKKCFIVYSPHEADDLADDISFLCADKKVHIRFRDFIEAEVISGFEKKLTYLLTYLMNYSFLPSIIGKYSDKELIDNFLKTSDLTSVYRVIKVNECSNKFRGFKLLKNYKKRHCKPFGEVDNECFPMCHENNMVTLGSLEMFLRMFKVTLKDYLFDDNYSVIIKSIKNKKENVKFINKAEKRKQSQADEYDLVKLW